MSTLRRISVRSFLVSEETAGIAIKELMTNSVHDLGLTVDNCRGKSYDCAGNMAGRYTGALTIIQRQSSKFILLLDKFILGETDHTNCWIHPCYLPDTRLEYRDLVYTTQAISFPEPTCLLASTKTRSSGIINKLVPRAVVSFAYKI